MNRLVQNLLELEISAGVSNGSLELKVADQGPGIAPGEEEAIFEKFARGRKSDPRGVGLGLIICRGIATAYGGTIRADHRPLGGACFIVTLPLGDAPPTLKED